MVPCWWKGTNMYFFPPHYLTLKSFFLVCCVHVDLYLNTQTGTQKPPIKSIEVHTLFILLHMLHKLKLKIFMYTISLVWLSAKLNIYGWTLHLFSYECFSSYSDGVCFNGQRNTVYNFALKEIYYRKMKMVALFLVSLTLNLTAPESDTLPDIPDTIQIPNDSLSD